MSYNCKLPATEHCHTDVRGDYSNCNPLILFWRNSPQSRRRCLNSNVFLRMQVRRSLQRTNGRRGIFHNRPPKHCRIYSKGIPPTSQTIKDIFAKTALAFAKIHMNLDFSFLWGLQRISACTTNSCKLKK